MKLTPFLLAPLFALMSCQHKEDSQRTAAAPTVPSAALAGPVEAGHPVIVRLVGRTKTMTVTATAKGPTYSVVSASGEQLLTQGTLDDLRRQHPDLYRQVRQGLASTHGDSAAAPTDADDFEHFLDYRLNAISAR